MIFNMFIRYLLLASSLKKHLWCRLSEKKEKYYKEHGTLKQEKKNERKIKAEMNEHRLHVSNIFFFQLVSLILFF